MADVAPSFEQTDIQGSSSAFRGTVGTTYVGVPSVPGGVIAEVLIDCPVAGNGASAYLDVSTDSGVTFFRVYRGVPLVWNLKGNVSQLSIRGSGANISYQVLMNREPV